MMKLIAETDLKGKGVRFFLHSRHLAQCYPNKSKSSMTTNVYRYLNGDIKSFNGMHYFYMEVSNMPLSVQSMAILEKEALQIAAAMLKEKSVKKLANIKSNK